MAIDQMLTELPEAEKIVDDMTLPELLQDTAHKGLLRIREIVMWAPDKENPAVTRLISDASLGAMKMLARVSEAQMRHSTRNDLVEQLQARIVELEGSKKKGGD